MTIKPKLTGLLTITLFLLLTFVAGCTSGGDSDEGGSGSDGGSDNATSTLSLTRKTIESFTDESGVVSIKFNIGSEIKAAQLEVFATEGKLALKSIRGPNSSVALAAFAGFKLSPTQAQGAPLVLALPLTGQTLASGTYTANFELTEIQGEGGAAFMEVNANLLTKNDNNLNSGVVKVNLALVGPLAESPELRDDLEDILSAAREIISKANISIDAKFYKIAGSDTLPSLKNGALVYEQIANQLRADSVNIIIAGDVEGLNNEDEKYTTIALGRYPASISKKSAAVISIRKLAGNDGRFNFDGEGADEVTKDEKRTAAEELAQLICHALGLEHVVDLLNDRVIAADSISDTASCVSLADCREEKAVRENIMYPSPLEIPDSDEEDYERANLTAGQAAQMNSSILVD